MDSPFENIKPLEPPTDKPPEKKARKTRAPKPAANTDNLAKTLEGLHAVIALGLALPEFVITESEAKMQADAISLVMAEYEIPISPATQAIINLGFVSFAIYAPRVQAVKARKQAEKEQAEKVETANETR